MEENNYYEDFIRMTRKMCIQTIILNIMTIFCWSVPTVYWYPILPCWGQIGYAVVSAGLIGWCIYSICFTIGTLKRSRLNYDNRR